MPEFIMFMYNDTIDQAAADSGDAWTRYITDLRSSGRFEGGSSIGQGAQMRKGNSDKPSETNLNGYILVRAESLEDARQFLTGNPVHEAGGTVEIRELMIDQ